MPQTYISRTLEGTIDEILREQFGANWPPKNMTEKTVPALEDWLLRGTYPEICVNTEVDRQLWCAGYIQTYLERDVRQIVKVGDLNSFQRFLHRGEPPSLDYWRSGSGLEIDLLIERNNQLYPFEIKSTQTVLPGHFEALNKWKELAGQPKQRGVLVAATTEGMSMLGNNVVPWLV